MKTPTDEEMLAGATEFTMVRPDGLRVRIARWMFMSDLRRPSTGWLAHVGEWGLVDPERPVKNWTGDEMLSGWVLKSSSRWPTAREAWQAALAAPAWDTRR